MKRCAQCGMEFAVRHGQNRKRFCDDRCRDAWLRANRTPEQKQRAIEMDRERRKEKRRVHAVRFE